MTFTFMNDYIYIYIYFFFILLTYNRRLDCTMYLTIQFQSSDEYAQSLDNSLTVVM